MQKLLNHWLTRLRHVNAELSEARLRHARSAVAPPARQPNVRVGSFFRHNQSASRTIMPEKTPLNSALEFPKRNDK